jgi:APA family basic amino acid/polyamine antiporter
MFIQNDRSGLKRNMGLGLLCLIGINGTIGGSIFVLMAGGVELAGNFIPLAFVIAGTLALLGGLLYAEVGTTIPRPGADLAFVFTASKKRSFPFIFSWAVLLGDLGYLAINALGFAFYANLYIGVHPLFIALGILAVSALVNIRGTEQATRSEAITIGLLITLFLAFTAYVGASTEGFSLHAGDVEGFRLSGVLAASALVFTSLVGYEYIATLAGEAKNPGKNVPLALVITIVFSTLVFAVVAFATVQGAPNSVITSSDAPLLAVTQYLGGIGTYIVVPAALLATSGSLIATTLITSRRLYALAHEGFFGSFLTKTNRRKIPARAIITSVVLAGLLVLSQAVNFVAYMANSVYLAGLIVVAISIMVLRKRRPYLPRPFKAPFYPLTPLLIIVLASTLLVFVEPRSLFAVGAWIVTGWLVYLLSSIEKKRWRLIYRGALIYALLLLFTLQITTLLAVYSL